MSSRLRFHDPRWVRNLYYFLDVFLFFNLDDFKHCCKVHIFDLWKLKQLIIPCLLTSVPGDTGSFEAKKTHIDNLYQMVQYCENKADCRRAQLLNYFGETGYNREKCRASRQTTCDNCMSKVSMSWTEVEMLWSHPHSWAFFIFLKVLFNVANLFILERWEPIRCHFGPLLVTLQKWKGSFQLSCLVPWAHLLHWIQFLSGYLNSDEILFTWCISLGICFFCTTHSNYDKVNTFKLDLYTVDLEVRSKHTINSYT